MTREKAIERLKYIKIHGADIPSESIDIQRRDIEALDMTIKTLEEEPSYNSVNSLAESKLKNPKVKTFDILHFVADNVGLSTFEAIEKAYIMGVSEQEQVLDKIRAEMFEEMLSHSGTGEEVIQAYADGLKKGLDILDKCKA